MSELSSSKMSSLLDKATIPARLQYLKENYPDKESFIFFTPHTREVFTFGSLYDLVTRFAWRLRNQGFKRYDVIANTLPNSPERMVTDLGIVFAGCIPLNGQIVLKSGDDFFRSERIAGCRAMVVCPCDRHHAWRLIRDVVTEIDGSLFARVSCAKAEELTTAILVNKGDTTRGSSLLEDLTSGESYVADVMPDDMAYLFTTSGSTGYSKLVPHSNKFCFDSFGENNSEIMKSNLEHNISTFNDRPLGWLGGYPYETYVTGVKRVMLDKLFDFKDAKEESLLTWKVLQAEKVDSAVILPHDFYEILEEHREIDPDDRVACIKTGGQPLTKAMAEDIFKISKSFLACYGSTEAGFVSTKLVKDIKEFTDFCAGKPVVEKLRIVNKDLQDCQPFELGTLWIKDTRVCSGYFMPFSPTKGRPTDVFLPDGWFNTEDIGYLDDCSELHVLGRQADVIMYGAHQVYPGWLEKAMASHPDISDVVIVAVSDPVLYHDICACVKPIPGVVLTDETLRRIADDLLVTDRDMDTTPVPHYFIVLDNFPVSGTGKTDRKLIRKMAEEKFGKTGKCHNGHH